MQSDNSQNDRSNSGPKTRVILIWVALILLVLLFVEWVTRSETATQWRQNHQNHIAIVPIYDGMSSMSPSRQLLQQISNNPNVKGVILDINSPGSVVTDAESFLIGLSLLRQNNIPIVSVIGNIGASGAYWVASASDRIFALRSSMVGSIGVTADLWSLNTLGKKVGIDVKSVGSGVHKGGNVFEPITLEEVQQVQSEVNELSQYFFEDVRQNRHLSMINMAEIKQGKIYNGLVAKSLGLVDEIGSLESGIAWMQQVALRSAMPVVYYQAQTQQSTDIIGMAQQMLLGAKEANAEGVKQLMTQLINQKHFSAFNATASLG
ncbi:MAG: S49 family peptidase [Candidatus Comchoanobacterales bacterium]